MKADQTQLQMVLTAILINSNEAIQDKGRIKITSEKRDLDEDGAQDAGLRPGPYVCLSIEDNGRGMNSEEREKIFEPFFTTKFQGRGMGMAAAYGIIKNHDGTLFVDSEPGNGTAVHILLPAMEGTFEKKKTPQLELVKGTGTILIIEDEDLVVDATRTMLERLGYRVLVAKSGADAVRLAETFEGDIDLALLDIKMPDMDGGVVYPLLIKARPELKAIVFSGYAVDGPAQAILDAGAQAFIQKSFTLNSLSTQIKRVREGKPL